MPHHPKSPRSLRRIILLTFLLIVAIITGLILGEPILRGFAIRHSILQAIDSAKVIRVTEHSNELDFVPRQKTGYREEIFQQLDLSPGQASALRRALPLAPDFSGSVFQACAFEDHHRIEIISSSGAIFRLDLCFHCGELRIDEGDQQIMPGGWDRSLKKFFTDLGMRPDGNFRKFAE